MRNAMNQKQMMSRMVVVLAAGLVSFAASADEGVIRAKVSYGLANYTAPSLSGNTTSTYPTLGLGVTYIFPTNIFADFSIKTSTSGASYNASNLTGGVVSSDQSFKRMENTLTIGKPLENGMQGNVGLFTADTQFDLGSFGQSSQKMMGVTSGVGKGLAIDEGRSGTIGLNGAVALLKATNTTYTGKSSDSNLAYGFSAGASYNYMFNKMITFSADAKFQTYFISYSGFSGDERIISTSASVIGQF